MGVVIEKVEWETRPIVYLFLFASCFASIFLLPYFSKNSTGSGAASVLNVGPSAPFLRFQRSFLLLYSLASVIGGLESVFGELEYQHYGVSREQMVCFLSSGAAVSLFVGTFVGIVSDLIGPRKACMMFCILHLFVGVLKIVTKHPSVWITSVCLAIASSIFSYSFETWMVTEHEKQGHRKDLLTDTFWLMTFFESASLIVSQGFSNLLVGDHKKGIFFPSASAALLAIISILYMRKEWNGWRHTSTIRDYRNFFSAHILGDKRIWILACAQSPMHFSYSIFWILWAPTIVADGREVHLSLIYPCFLGSRMLGSTAVSWLFSGASPLCSDDCLAAAFVIAGFALSIVAYDYQDIGVLVTLFCIYHACAGLIFPSLAQLRTMYVPNELRGGMISLSSVPANAALLFVLIQGGYYRNLSNATIMALSALGMFAAAGCILLLKRRRKQSHENWHKL